MKSLPKWFLIELLMLIILLIIVYVISDAISIVPWAEKNRYCGFYIFSGITFVVALVSFLYIKKKNNKKLN
jgi:hypothetical protein